MGLVDKYTECIKSKFPQIMIKSIKMGNEGQNNDVVIINDQYVFKFPKYLKGITQLRNETKILRILKKYLTLHIPQPEFENFDTGKIGEVFCGYRIIKGSSLTKELLFQAKNRQIIAEQLAVFLKELHSIPVNEVRDIVIPVLDGHKQWYQLLNKIQNKLFPYMDENKQESIRNNFSTFLNRTESFEPVIIHGDFGPSNIILDTDNGMIEGIIDFSDISVGDPALDIAALMGPYGFDEDFITFFSHIYLSVDSMLDRAKFYASTFALQEALFGLENGDMEAFNSGMKKYT